MDGAPMSAKKIIVKMSFKVTKLPKDQIRVELISSDGQVYADWTSIFKGDGFAFKVGEFYMQTQFSSDREFVPDSE
jgi:hypothetical protein